MRSIEYYILHAADGTRWLKMSKPTVPQLIEGKARGTIRKHWNHGWWMQRIEHAGGRYVFSNTKKPVEDWELHHWK